MGNHKLNHNLNSSLFLVFQSIDFSMNIPIIRPLEVGYHYVL